MPSWFQRMLPEQVRAWLMPLLSPGVLLALAIGSGVMFVASLIGVPYFLARLPADYFSRRERAELGLQAPSRSLGALTLRILRNLLGWMLVLLGLAMLVLPGQALLTLLVAALLIDFPGKRRFERWVIGRPVVMKSINQLRKRSGRPPLESRLSWLPPRPSSAPPPRGKASGN